VRGVRERAGRPTLSGSRYALRRHWSLRGRPLCAVGHLLETCRALGWRIL